VNARAAQEIAQVNDRRRLSRERSMQKSYKSRTPTVRSFFVASLLAIASTAQSQLVRGIVRDSASNFPLAGAVVTATDSVGSSVARTLTNERGEFRVDISGARTLRFINIGFRPRTIDVSSLGAGGAVSIAMGRLPTLLTPTRTIDQASCPASSDRAAAFALWDQARAVFLATVVSQEEHPAELLRLNYRKVIDRNGTRVRSMSVRSDSTSAARSFSAALDATAFLRDGFVFDSGAVTVYHGPDAATLLDSMFITGYCYSIAARDDARPMQVGLRFEPSSYRSGRTDIAGVAWIDTLARRVVDLTYDYKIPGRRPSPFNPGGRISFQTFPNGSTLIDRWSIQFEEAPPATSAPSPAAELRAGPRVIEETGGELADARWNDLAWIAHLGHVRGSVMRGGVPAAHTVVRLIDTDYATMTDSSGFFAIDSLVPGPYTVAVVDADLITIGMVLNTDAQFVAVRDSTVTIQARAPSMNEYGLQLCRFSRAGDPIVSGLVTDPETRAGVQATVAASMFSFTGERIPLETVKTDASGHFHICDLPNGRVVEFAATLRGEDPTRTTRVLNKRVETVLITLRP
jgi:hypothetical protein